MKKEDNPIERIHKDIEDKRHIFGSLRAMSANAFIEKARMEPDPVDLYDEIIFENTMVALFSDTGLGKSTLAVQIGEKIAKERSVLYLDCELTDKQFQLRYRSTEGHHHVFPDQFIRVTINNQAVLENEEEILDDIILVSKELDSKILIIDNLTYLCNNSEKGNSASSFMKKLKVLKDQGFTIIVIAHTPKLSQFRPINDCDMAGSRRLANFFDTMIAIGRSSVNPTLRYIKQVKGNRTSQNKYDSNNVLICQLAKIEDALRLEPIKTDYERNHLKQVEENEEKLLETIVDLKSQGVSMRDIAKEVGKSKSTVSRIIKKESNAKI